MVHVLEIFKNSRTRLGGEVRAGRVLDRFHKILSNIGYIHSRPMATFQ